MWVYVPGTRQVLRISPQQRVLGGVASADVARMVFSLDYRLDSVEELAGEGGERRRRLKPFPAVEGERPMRASSCSPAARKRVRSRPICSPPPAAVA